MKRFVKRPALLLACALLLSVSVANPYCEAERWEGEPSNATSEAPPLTLGAAVALAASSSGVRAAAAQLELACAALTAAANPVTANAVGGAEASSDFGDGTDGSLEFSLDVSVRPPLGAAAEALAAAERSVEAAADALNTALFDSVKQTVRLYGEALSSAGALEVAELQAKIAELQLQGVQARVEVGAALTSDLTQAELAWSSALLDVSAAEAALAAAYTELSLHLGVLVTGVLSDLPGDEPLAGELMEGKLAARADVRGAARDVAAAAEALAQARRASGINVSGSASLSATEGNSSLSLGASVDTRELSPSLTGRLSASTSTAARGSSGSSGAAPNWRGSVGVSVTVPLAPPDTRVRSAEVSFEAAKERLARLEKSAEVQATAARSRVEASAARLELAAVRAELATGAADDAAARFALGTVGQLEVLQSSVAALQAQNQLHAARLERLADLLALIEALGGAPTEVPW